MKALLLASAVMVFCSSSLPAVQRPTPPVRTGQGLLRGQTDGSVDRFFGIPYAAPPVGDLRWKPPAAAPSWNGVRDAFQPGSQCIQLAASRGEEAQVEGSEDCLYLNVYRPANTTSSQALPVFVYIHGGSNQKGSANDYDPSGMVAQTGIIVVTIEYRLNVFGFLALPSLDSEAGEPASGNYGLLDQQAALRWVQANIAGFGGDPRQVTAGGESAGGIDLCAHLVSPLSAGLFDKAVLQSMYCPATSHEEALSVSAPVAAALGCTGSSNAAACMRARTAGDVLKGAGRMSVQPGGGPGFNASPNFGNSILPFKPAVALETGKWNRAAILIGSTHDESALFVAPQLVAAGVRMPLSEDAYRLIVGSRFGTFAPSVLHEYPASAYSSPFAAYVGLSTDNSPLGCAVSSLAGSLSALHQTFRYEFNDPNAPSPLLLRLLLRGTPMMAFHGSELQYLFGMSKLPGPRTAAQRQLSTQMIAYWGNFVKTGNPNGPGLPDWPPYDAGTHRLLSLRPGDSVVIDNFDMDHHCSFWASAPSR